MADRAESQTLHLTPAQAIFAPRFLTTKDGVRVRAASFPALEEYGRGQSCVLLNGQTEFIEKYFEVIDELRVRGFDVVTMDWRGQGGSTRALADPLKVHIEDFSQYDDDLQTLMLEVIAPSAKRPPIGLAHSMGGHILLRCLHNRHDAFACTILCAPMIAINTRGQPAWLARAVTASMILRGASQGWVWGMKGRDQLKVAFDNQVVTSDPKRFQRTVEVLKKNPDIRLGGPTWGWLEAAFRSMRKMRAHRYAGAITTPTLIIGAGHDRVCISRAAKVFASHMPHGHYVEIDGAEHEILMEQDHFRAQFWKEFDAFVAEFA
jgi:lysophospholipase